MAAECATLEVIGLRPGWLNIVTFPVSLCTGGTDAGAVATKLRPDNATLMKARKENATETMVNLGVLYPQV